MASDKRKVDSLDRRILAALQKDPQLSNRRLADDVGSNEFTIATRIERLKSDRLMKITVQRDMRTLGYGLVGFADVSVSGAEVSQVGRTLSEIPEVFSVTLFADSPEIRMMIMTRSPRHLWDIVENQIGKVGGVESVEASLALGDVYIRAGIASL